MFDVDRPRYVSVDQAARDIGFGWLAQFRGTSYISRLIQASTGGVHSHSAMLAPGGRDGITVIEIREGYGGRLVPLRQYVAEESRRIDVFSIDSQRWPEFDGLGAVAEMQSLAHRCRYNYWQIWRLALRKLPAIWRLPHLRPSTDDGASIGNVAAHCSHAVAHACRVGGGVDPVPRCPDHFVDPNQLTRSLLFRYYGTLE